MQQNSIMQRFGAMARPQSVCHICQSISTQRRRIAAPLLTSRNVFYPSLHQPRRALSSIITSSKSRPLSAGIFPSFGKKAASAVKSQTGNSSLLEKNKKKNDNDKDEDDGASAIQAATGTATAPSLHPSSVADIMGYLKSSVSKVSSARGIPSEKHVSEALSVCEMLANWFTDEAVQPQIAHAIKELDSTASTLLSLDDDTKTTQQSSQLPEGIEYSAKLRQLTDKISETAYLLLAHPPVVITAELLEQYVKVQSKLGRPETFPKIFELYASKPAPREGSIPLTYKKRRPNFFTNAIQPKVADAALATAIEAKNLDAAVGIVATSYGTKAFVHNKMFRRATLPILTFSASPFAAWILGEWYSASQDALDKDEAVWIGFLGIFAYVSFTSMLGFIALATHNDHFRRVSWAEGYPLRFRWYREEERAALDKIACAWGFQEIPRWGEEDGPDWAGLKAYISQRDMILDRIELLTEILENPKILDD